MQQEINSPVNLCSSDEKYFDCLKWNYEDPKIKNHYFSFLFQKGCSTNFLLKPLKKIEPWAGFYKNYKVTFFLGELLKGLKNRKIHLSIHPVYFCCVNEFSDNFFHWFTEAIPKMIFIKEHYSPGAKFYIPFSLKDYQRITLKLCDLNFYEAKSEVTFFYKLKAVENLYKYPGYYHTDLMKETARLMKKRFSTVRNKKRKIYVTRKNASRRRIINEDDVIAVLLKNDFEIFDFDLINFEKQVEILIDTEILVSLHGAALTNMLFMETGSTIIEFLPKKVINDKCYFILAGTMKHNYYYVSCDMNGSSHITSDFVVDAFEFEKVLTNAVASSFKSLPS